MTQRPVSDQPGDLRSCNCTRLETELANLQEWMIALSAHLSPALVKAMDERLNGKATDVVAQRDRLLAALDELYDAALGDDGGDADHARILDAMEHARVILDDFDKPAKPWQMPEFPPETYPEGTGPFGF